MEESKALKMHRKWCGKITIKPKAKVGTREELSLAYTPGVADACLAIKNNIEEGYNLTMKGNFVAVITDGTAILGLGNIGPLGGMPVMEGKCALFKAYADVDAVPICLATQDTEEIIKTIKYLEPSFGGINLEDISAPRCFEIERRLKEELDIPVFHDDQHGTAIVVGAALINALKIIKKDIKSLQVVVNGAGAAGTAIGKYLLAMGVDDVVFVDRYGIINRDEEYENKAHNELAKISNKQNLKGTLKDAIKGKDLFVGVSVGNILSKEMVASMNKDAIVFALANPVSEIPYQDALDAGARIVGTGSSKFPNQINNVLVFPGLFKGAMSVRATDINIEMMMAASRGIAEAVSEEELKEDYILPYAFDRKAHESVIKNVAEAAIATKVNRI
ncbi:MAG: NADP-dependent malic enzyme [Bacilli bacterium]|nr:NADP-dependent malic enzyme [Bacilli bacterium]